MTPTPSPRAIGQIESFEIGSAASYAQHPTWPGGASGVTIGIGCDLGYLTPDQFATTWNDKLPADAVRALRLVCGQKAGAARNVLHTVADVLVPFAAARTVFEQRDIPRYSSLTAVTFPGSDGLSGDSFGALVSLVFNRGAGMVDGAPPPSQSRLEMRQIRDALAAGRPGDVPGLLRAMKRLWVGQNLGGLIARREAEAVLFEEGMRTAENSALLAATPKPAADGQILPISVVQPATPQSAEKSADPPESDADRLNDAELAGLG